MLIRAVVISGRSLGRTIGFPTANIALPQGLEIDNGVYRTTITFGGVQYRSISNVGVKPTVGGSEKALECHIFDFEGDLYGQNVEVELHEKLRDEKRFDSVEALREQIKEDIERVKKLK